MKDKRTAEGGDILNFENFVTRPMQEQGMVVCHEAASSTRWFLGGCSASSIESLRGDRKKRDYASGPCGDVFPPERMFLLRALQIRRLEV